MKRETQNDPLVEEIGDLVEEVVLTEATASVWYKFQKVLSVLDPEDLDILEKHLDGISSNEIGLEKQLSCEQVNTIIKKIKSEVLQRLKLECDMRH